MDKKIKNVIFMNESKVVKCKMEQEVNKLISFFESVFSETGVLDEIKKTSESRRSTMIENIDNSNYQMLFINYNYKIVAGLYAFLVGETLYLETIAVDKDYRKKGLSKFLINYVIENCGISIKKIVVIPNKYDKDKSFNYYLHSGFNALLCISYFGNIDFEKYNKYHLNVFSNKVDTYNDNGITKNYNHVLYEVPNPSKEYVIYYENAIKDCTCYYMFVKELNLDNNKEINTTKFTP